MCESEGGLLDFGFPASFIHELLPKLSAEAGGRERKLHLLRRNNRFLLRLKGGEFQDVTGHRGDFAWLEKLDSENGTRRGRPGEVRVRSDFMIGVYATCRRGRLELLDEIGLPDGTLVLAKIERVDSVPSTAALRRIVARGGPASLPSDFAEQHDHYARGAPRR